MQVIQLSASDISGGAPRAAYRIHQCLPKVGINSRMWVDRAESGDWTVECPADKLRRLTVELRGRIGGQFSRVLRTGNPILHSSAVLPSLWPGQLNRSEADIVHLHWVGNEMLSIADIGRIRKPLVWTLHDMWAFCGAEHYTDDDRFRTGYKTTNRPDHEGRFDLNRWTWERKRKHWQTPIQIVTPSHWLAKCVRESVLMRDWPVHVVPNPLDTDLWRPLEQRLARDILGLPPEEPLLLFGALGGGHDPRKGFDLLQSALAHLRGQAAGLRLMVFGQLAPSQPPNLGYPVHYTGRLYDDLSLRVLYSAADVFVIPSRQDNLPNTGVEALACGTPVVAFDTGGLMDIVTHQQTGYLAQAFDAEDLAAGIDWVLNHADAAYLHRNARAHAEQKFACSVVAEQYRRVYEAAIDYISAQTSTFQTNPRLSGK